MLIFVWLQVCMGSLRKVDNNILASPLSQGNVLRTKLAAESQLRLSGLFNNPRHLPDH